MGARDEDLTKFAGFAGLNNRSKETALPANVPREIVDLDLDRDSKISSRRGYTAPIVSTTLGHSLWSDDHLSFALFADGNKLMAFESDQAVQVANGLADGLPISYALIADSVYWSNSLQCGLVSQALEAFPWACEQPDGQPQLELQPDGTLSGDLQVCITFIDALGRESGATLAASITASGGSRLRIHGIPQPRDPATSKVAVYATDANGTALMRAAVLPAGITEYTIIGAPTGRALATQFLRPLPAGHIVRLFNGRQLVARDNLLVWSQPLRYGLFHPGHNYIRFPKRIDLLEPVDDGGPGAGVYVASGPNTFFLAGPEPAQWAQRRAATVGAVAGSACITPGNAWGLESQAPVPAWLSAAGLHTIGLPGGQLLSFNRDQLALGVGDSAASIFRDADGLSQFLTAVQGATLPRAGIADTAIATVYRHDRGLP